MPVTVDNLSTGSEEAVKFGPFTQSDIMNPSELDELFTKWSPRAVIHLAALTSVEESVAQPLAYQECNLVGTENIVNAMLKHRCQLIVFSSTCAVYGNAPGGLVTENSAVEPQSPYAETKLAAENLLSKYSEQNNIKPMIFRYFNVAGADPEQEIGEWKPSPSNLIPSVLECAIGARSEFEIFGTDYPTPDGTCIRDYVHANDIADAHVQGLQALLNDGSGDLFNLGTGKGYSVREVVDCCRKITSIDFHVQERTRRAGDVARIVSDCAKAEEKLGWTPRHSSLPTIIADAWRWRLKGGYQLKSGGSPD